MLCDVQELSLLSLQLFDRDLDQALVFHLLLFGFFLCGGGVGTLFTFLTFLFFVNLLLNLARHLGQRPLLDAAVLNFAHLNLNLEILVKLYALFILESPLSHRLVYNEHTITVDEARVEPEVEQLLVLLLSMIDLDLHVVIDEHLVFGIELGRLFHFVLAV